MNRVQWLRSWLAVLAAPLLGSCMRGHVTLNVKAPPGANEGRPLYMVVRKVDPKQYATETYSDVAAKVVNPDATLLLTEVIYPGTLQHIQVKVPEDAPVAVSFLFTAPDGSWQMLLDTPGSSVNIELWNSQIRTDAATPGLNEGTPPPPLEKGLPKVAVPSE